MDYCICQLVCTLIAFLCERVHCLLIWILKFHKSWTVKPSSLFTLECSFYLLSNFYIVYYFIFNSEGIWIIRPCFLNSWGPQLFLIWFSELLLLRSESLKYFQTHKFLNVWIFQCPESWNSEMLDWKKNLNVWILEFEIKNCWIWFINIWTNERSHRFNVWTFESLDSLPKFT